MPIDQCPGCGNDLYAPYTYCNACEWEAKGKKKQARERKAKEQKEKQKKRKGRERKENVKHRERDEEWEPIPSKKQSRGMNRHRQNGVPVKNIANRHQKMSQLIGRKRNTNRNPPVARHADPNRLKFHVNVAEPS